jgi:hypothetical protein
MNSSRQPKTISTPKHMLWIASPPAAPAGHANHRPEEVFAGSYTDIKRGLTECIVQINMEFLL